MTEYTIKPLDSETWDAYARLLESSDHRPNSRASITGRSTKQLSSAFLYNGTRSMYENAGFEYERPKGKNNCVMRKVVPAA
jgi:hypothetical protein